MLAGLKRIVRGIKGTAKNREIEFRLDDQELFALITSECAYCGAEPRERELWINGGREVVRGNGVDRIDSDLGYIQGNVIACCITCNRMKSDLSIQDFLSHMKRVLAREERILTTVKVSTKAQES